MTTTTPKVTLKPHETFEYAGVPAGPPLPEALPRPAMSYLSEEAWAEQLAACVAAFQSDYPGLSREAAERLGWNYLCEVVSATSRKIDEHVIEHLRRNHGPEQSDA